MPSLAIHLPFLISGLDLRAWSDCWVFVEFFYDSITRKGSGSSTTTTSWCLSYAKKHIINAMIEIIICQKIFKLKINVHNSTLVISITI